MIREPIPPAGRGTCRVGEVATAHGPVAFIGVSHTVHLVAAGIIDGNFLACVAKRAVPIPDYIRDSRIFGVEAGQVRAEHEVSSRPQGHSGETEVNSLLHFPPSEVQAV